MAAAARISVLQTPPGGGGKVAAVGPTDREAIFIALVPGIGFRYLDLAAEPPGCWATAGGFSGSVTGSFGLHHRHGSGATAFVSFAEAPPRSWTCLRIPSVGESMSVDEAAVVERTTLPADIVAACGPGAEEGEEAVLVLASGALRFMDLTTGKAAGKALKLDAPAAGAAVAACGLGAGRVAVVRQGGEFFVAELDREQRKAVLRHSGRLGLGGSAVPPPSAQLLSVAAAATPGQKDRVILCWGTPGGKKEAASRTFATATLSSEAPSAALLPASPAAGAAALWLCVAGYVAEWAPASGKSALSLIVRDARFGMLVASAEVPLASTKTDSQWLSCTAGGTTLLVGGRGGDLAAVRWVLPTFSLQLVIGAGERTAPEAPEGAAAAASFGPLREAAAGKRPAEDPGLEELFSAKRHKSTDEELAKQVKCRAWPPSETLVDVVAQRRCWASARALLGLPELAEDLAVRLLAADQQLQASLLAPAVRRPFTARLLEAALGDHLPPSLLPGLLEVLLEWLEAYRDFTQAEMEEAVPGMPSQAEIVRFLSAVADGCLPSLLRLEADLLERVGEALAFVGKERARTERAHAAARAAARLGREGLAAGCAAREAPAVEAVLVDF